MIVSLWSSLIFIIITYNYYQLGQSPNQIFIRFCYKKGGYFRNCSYWSQHLSYTQLLVNMELSNILTYAKDLKTLLSAYDNSIQQLTMLGGYYTDFSISQIIYFKTKKNMLWCYTDFSTTLFLSIDKKNNMFFGKVIFLNITNVYIQVQMKR